MSVASLPPAPEGWGPPTFAPIPFEAFRRELLALYEPPLRARATHLKMRQALDLVAGLAGPGGTTADLSPDLVARLLKGRPEGESPNTTVTLLSMVRAACNYAKSRGYLRYTPFEFRRRWVRASPPKGRRHHSLDEIRRVLDLLAADVRDREGWPRWRARRLQAVAALVAYTGLRRDEALYLRAEDVDLESRMIHVVARADRRLKTEGSAQPVPVPEALVPILAGWLARRMDAPERGSGRPPECPYLFPNVTRTGPWCQDRGTFGHKPLDQLKAAGRRAGVEGFTFLSLRHSFATHAESAWGLSPAQIQRMLRHCSQETQRHYRHADAANLRASAGGIGFGPAGEGGPNP